ncbi:MAG: DUF5659 domain-containing protein [Dehalococcoidales bacterium]|nr:DUF5659 domain-containing protein [Dehalococcoidales bacterium]
MVQPPSTNNQFLTTDTPLAAYLVQAGHEVIGILYEPKHNGKQRGTYVFRDSPELHELVNLFNRGEAKVNVALYEHAKSSLIDRIMRGLQ